jgi:hypothetical protein
MLGEELARRAMQCRTPAQPALHKPLHKAAQPSPITPIGADNRTSNLLILLVPADDPASVTAEVASSSLVVPAILFQSLTKDEWLPRLVFNPNSNPITHSSRPIWIFRHNLYGIQILSLSLNLLHVHRMNIASSCLRFRMAEHRLDY